MLLDDNADELQIAKNIIESNLPVSVIAVSSPQQAMRYIDLYSDRIEAYIFDIEMVGNRYSGIQLAEYVRNTADGALVPIIFLTSHAHYGLGYLRPIHYYDFFVKPLEKDALLQSLRGALSISNTSDVCNHLLILTSCGISVDLDFEDISCIEINGRHLSVTDLLGKVKTYTVKYKTFSNIVRFVENESMCKFRQIHRCVIINTDRIRRIEWGKNTASIWLFNVKECKPVGKTFLSQVAVFNKKPNV